MDRRFFLFVFKMLAEGDAALRQRAASGAITAQLAGHLPDEAVRLGVRVAEVSVHDGRAVGVCGDGRTIMGEAVVLATEMTEAAKLGGIKSPMPRARPRNVRHFTSRPSLYSRPKLVLNAMPDAVVNNVTQLTTLHQRTAPAGQHLISAVLLGEQTGDDAALVERTRADLARIFPLFPVTLLHLLHIRIPLAQFDQPPGILYPQLPPNTTVIPGLFAAGEYTESSSIHGAMHSGEKVRLAVAGG